MLAILIFRLGMLVMLSGLCAAVWGFSRSGKIGYIVMAISFVLGLGLSVFLYGEPVGLEPTNPELQAKIDQTITEYLQTESAGSEIEPFRVKVSTSFMVNPSLLSFVAWVILVIGLWLLAWSETKGGRVRDNVRS